MLATCKPTNAQSIKEYIFGRMCAGATDADILDELKSEPTAQEQDLITLVSRVRS